jgi:hypothetical protein
VFSDVVPFVEQSVRTMPIEVAWVGSAILDFWSV